MPSRAKKPPMTEQQLATQADRRRSSNMIDKRAEAREQNDAELSKLIDISLAGLRNVASGEQGVALADTDTVKEITLKYMEMCRERSVIPSFTDLASAIGCTRQAFYAFIKAHPGHPTSNWLLHLRDVFSDILAKSALNGTTRDIPSIFVLKSKYGWREDVDDMPQNDNSQEQMDVETIMEKYKDLPD